MAMVKGMRGIATSFLGEVLNWTQGLVLRFLPSSHRSFVGRLGTGFCCPKFFRGSRQALRYVVGPNFGLVVLYL